MHPSFAMQEQSIFAERHANDTPAVTKLQKLAAFLHAIDLFASSQHMSAAPVANCNELLNHVSFANHMHMPYHPSGHHLYDKEKTFVFSMRAT